VKFCEEEEKKNVDGGITIKEKSNLRNFFSIIYSCTIYVYSMKK
jgi:hypothetical protein